MTDIYAAPSETFYSTLENATSGLVGIIGVRIINKATGATTTARTTSGITEPVASSGTYIAALTAPGSEGRYSVLWDTGSVTPSTTGSDDLVVSTDTSGGAPSISALLDSLEAGGLTVTVLSPVAQDGTIIIVNGNDYNATDNRALDFVNEEGSWPTTGGDLTGATITFVVKHSQTGTTELTKAGSVITPTGANQKVRVALTAAETAAIPVGRHHIYSVYATLSTRIATLQLGNLTVLGNPG